MMRHWMVLLTAGAVIAGASAEALAADKEDYYRDYAGMAVAAARNNIHWNCGYRGPRYTTSWQAHFVWCMAVDRAASDSEREIRGHEMRACNRG